MRKFFFYIFASIAFLASAQSVEQGLQVDWLIQLNSLYSQGNIDEVISEGQRLVGKMAGSNKAQVYRLLAHAYIMNDEPDEAEKAVQNLLSVDFNYGITPDDDAHFVRLIEKHRDNTMQISSASLTSESLNEIPVPITIIDAEMIKLSGARNIKEVLLTFVPGLADYEGQFDSNLSSRMVAAAGQENMLFLLNGHRMNEKSTNKAVPDYSISLDKIESIEVLRGPASAIYGCAALMNVVNIKTKSGGTIDGGEVTAKAGSRGTIGGGALVGANRGEIDFTLWGNVFTSKGEDYKLDAGTYAHIEKYNKKPSYDFGGTLKWKGFELLFSLSHGHKANTTSTYLTDTGSGYDYDQWEVINGNGVGVSHTNYLVGFGYTKKLGKFTVSANGSFTSNLIQHYATSGDNCEYFESPRYYNFTWREDGINARVAAAYETRNSWGDMLIMGGVNVEYMNVTDGSQTYGSYYADTVVYNDNYVTAFQKTPIVATGIENAISPFLQFKQKFGRHWLLNVGLGYDVRYMHGDNDTRRFSPRASLVYIKDENFNVKINYGKAFINAPYYYRANELVTTVLIQGELNPETIDSYQINAYWRFSPKWNLNTVVYYNYLNDIIKAASVSNVIEYSCNTSMENIGLEAEIHYNKSAEDRMMFNATMTLQRNCASKAGKEPNGTLSTSGLDHDIPNFITNVVFGYKVWDKPNHSLWLTTNSRFVGTQKLVINERLSAHLLFNAGVTYNYRSLEASINGYNIPGYRYFHGGATTVSHPQEGRTILGTVRYKF